MPKGYSCTKRHKLHKIVAYWLTKRQNDNLLFANLTLEWNIRLEISLRLNTLQ